MNTKNLLQLVRALQDAPHEYFLNPTPWSLRSMVRGYGLASDEWNLCVSEIGAQLASESSRGRMLDVFSEAELQASSARAAFEWLVGVMLKNIDSRPRVVPEPYFGLLPDMPVVDAKKPFEVSVLMKHLRVNSLLRDYVDESIFNFKNFVDGYLVACRHLGFDVTSQVSELNEFSRWITEVLIRRELRRELGWDQLIFVQAQASMNNAFKLLGEAFRMYRKSLSSSRIRPT